MTGHVCPTAIPPIHITLFRRSITMSAASPIPNKTLAVRGLTKRMGERVLWSGLNLEFLPGR